MRHGLSVFRMLRSYFIKRLVHGMDISWCLPFPTVSISEMMNIRSLITLCLKSSFSSKVNESDLAMTGMTLALRDNSFNAKRSNSFNLGLQLLLIFILGSGGIDKVEDTMNAVILRWGSKVSVSFSFQVDLILFIDILCQRHQTEF